MRDQIKSDLNVFKSDLIAINAEIKPHNIKSNLVIYSNIFMALLKWLLSEKQELYLLSPN
jgi:hypothetical protein